MVALYTRAPASGHTRARPWLASGLGMRFVLLRYLVKADARWQQVSTFANFPVNAGRILKVNKGDLIFTRRHRSAPTSS
jgi:hypothetical protein